MTKKVLMYQIFIMMCAVVESKETSCELGVNLLKKALNNDMSYLDELPDTVSSAFTEIHQDIFRLVRNLKETEKKMILENIYKEVYEMLQNLEKSNNINLTYVERARGKYTATLKLALVNVLIAYVGEGISLKSQYQAFKSDYDRYAKSHMGPISEIADTQKRLGLKEAINQRENEADYLMDKYKSLKLTKCDLRTPLEDETLWKDNMSVAI